VTTLKRIPFHPILFGLYPVFALLANNIREVNPAVITRPLVMSLLVVVILTLVFRTFMGDIRRAAVSSSFTALILLSYGHFYSLIHHPNVFGVSVGRHRYFLPIVLAFALLGIWWVRAKLKKLEAFTSTLNFIAVIILVVPIYQIVDFQIRSLKAQTSEQGDRTLYDIDINAFNTSAGQIPPDVYYIILDGYGRDDVLKTFFDVDNSAFLTSLEDLGFYVAPCSKSNYGMTTLSLGSSLNMNYIQGLGIDIEHADLSSFGEVTEHSVVRSIFENLGYKIVAFESGYYVTEWDDSDLYFSTHSNALRWTSGLIPFEAIFLEGTIGKVLVDFQYLLPEEISVFLNSAYTEHRERIIYTLETLEELPSVEGPLFVMAHIIAPHEPFVFGPNGEFVTQTETFTLKEDIYRTDWEDYKVGYRDQVSYLNTRVEQLVQTLLSRSRTPPIIILQGDHGPLAFNPSLGEARMSILNAYHLPGDGDQLLYPSISPVNSFRVVMNAYFDGELEMLDDIAYSSTYLEPFDFSVISETRRICGED
jgi:hypothetical protein